jgi:hypothetical protein
MAKIAQNLVANPAKKHQKIAHKHFLAMIKPRSLGSFAFFIY